MRPLSIGIYIIAAFGLCAALPIRSVAIGDRNAFLLGALVFISFGAVLAGCVCCRRRKKGFEEFKNESGTLESNKTEYPIFRALSPESQRSVVAVNAGSPAINNSNENLIVDDIDNNNGPISPADLENIENNNAVDYIQNQNEIGIIIEPSPYSRNRNLLESSNVEQEQANEELLQNIAINSTTDFLTPTSQTSADISDINLNTHIDSNVVTGTPVDAEVHLTNVSTYDKNVEEETIVQENVPILNAELCSNLHQDENRVYPTIIEIEPSSKEAFSSSELTLEAEKEVSIIPEESSSIKSVSSEKSNEINSVEEALRVLDSAIEAEELNIDYDDDDDLPDEEFGDDTTNFQHVIRQLLINNGINGILPNLTTDQENLDTSTEKTNIAIESIREEAVNLVDSILNESRLLAEQRREALKNNPQTTIQVFTVTECSFEHNRNNNIENENSAKCITSYLCTQPKTDSNSPHLNNAGSEEELFSEELLAKTSTPCIENKFSASSSNKILTNKNIVQNLFDCNAEISKTDLDQSFKTISSTELEDLPNVENVTFQQSPISDQTFEINKTFEVNKTFEMNKTLEINTKQENHADFTYPGDPCTSKQALERDCGLPLIKCDRDEMNSDDLTTITPVNTPIELNYPNDTWDRITKPTSAGLRSDDCEDINSKGGWFLHPQTNVESNETFDLEDEANLELTFEALRKQLAEVLPQPQGISGPPEYSDDDDEQQNNRTFDEYRSPLDGLMGLLDVDPSVSTSAQNEVYINYKRPLSPIIEESEEDTCRTFVMNETKCLDSTSTGCMDIGEAIMGVTKTLMASNDTLFNFEDTLGEKEDIFSPRAPSRTESQANTPVKNYKSLEDNSLGTSGSDTDRGARMQGSPIECPEENLVERRSPPKSIDFLEPSELKPESDLCSPDQQKTFSDGTSSTTDRLSSDVSPTVDHDTTFTANTIDEKTCITVIVKDDERISEISEPEWGSTASCGGYELNSLTDVPSLDFNVNNFDKDFEDLLEHDNEIEEKASLEENIVESSIENAPNDAEKDSGQDDSGHSTQASTDDKSISNNMSAQDAHSLEENNTLINQLIPSNIHVYQDIKQNCIQFLKNEVEVSSSQVLKNRKDVPQHQQQPQHHQQQQLLLIDSDIDGWKENTDPNVKIILNNSFENDKISYPKVQMSSQDTVIVDKSKNISSDFMEKDFTNGVHDNIFHQSDITILPTKHQQAITNYSVNDVDGIQNEQNCLMVADEILGHLSGEEDPWAEPVNDIRFTGPCSEIISTSFSMNEWDSDVDDSHSSEEFMYVRGTPTKGDILKLKNDDATDSDKQFSTTDGTYESNIWSSHEDKVPVGIRNSVEDEVSEESSSEFEGEFVPSCWDSMAMPARSALKSPDKSSSETKKRRSVVFKKQRYHSVYEYPRETSSLSPAYSEPFLWNKVTDTNLVNGRDHLEDFSVYNADGFTVFSSMRPFHGSQFNALCHTWPTDSDFSWSQVEDLSSITDDKQLPTYSNIEIKWPQSYVAHTENSEDTSINSKSDESKRPDSGVGASAEMLSDKGSSLGELRHTKSTLRLPLEQLPAVEPPIPSPPLPPQEFKTAPKQNDLNIDSLILPTPSCTGSMDSLSSSSSSERQLSFTTFGKKNLINENEKRIYNDVNDQTRPALILFDGQPTDNGLKPDKIKQSDSTDEDSGIESIMKVNKESD